MLSAYNQQEDDVVAWEVTREQGPFFCPECRDEVVVKKGHLKVHHFAHLPGTYCAYGTGESEQHKQAKYEIYQTLREHSSVTQIKVERSLGDVRPDISFYWQHKYKVAIELQISDNSINEISRRTRSYTAKNIWVLWTIPYHSNISCLTPYRTGFWERYLHALYFGKCYYWLRGQTLLPVHFEPYILEGNLKERYYEDTGTWHLNLVKKPSPVLRNLDFGDHINITDMKPITRPSKQIGPFPLPYSRLWSIPNPKRQGGN